VRARVSPLYLFGCANRIMTRVRVWWAVVANGFRTYRYYYYYYYYCYCYYIIRSLLRSLRSKRLMTPVRYVHIGIAKSTLILIIIGRYIGIPTILQSQRVYTASSLRYIFFMFFIIVEHVSR